MTELNALFNDLFEGIKRVERIPNKDPLTHPILLKFKPKFHEHKTGDFKLLWYPYELYLRQLKLYYKKYYGLKQIKQNDSTLKELVDDFTAQISYYKILFTDQSQYKLIEKKG